MKKRIVTFIAFCLILIMVISMCSCKKQELTITNYNETGATNLTGYLTVEPTTHQDGIPDYIQYYIDIDLNSQNGDGRGVIKATTNKEAGTNAENWSDVANFFIKGSVIYFDLETYAHYFLSEEKQDTVLNYYEVFGELDLLHYDDNEFTDIESAQNINLPALISEMEQIVKSSSILKTADKTKFLTITDNYDENKQDITIDSSKINKFAEKIYFAKGEKYEDILALFGAKISEAGVGPDAAISMDENSALRKSIVSTLKLLAGEQDESVTTPIYTEEELSKMSEQELAEYEQQLNNSLAASENEVSPIAIPVFNINATIAYEREKVQINFNGIVNADIEKKITGDFRYTSIPQFNVSVPMSYSDHNKTVDMLNYVHSEPIEYEEHELSEEEKAQLQKILEQMGSSDIIEDSQDQSVSEGGAENEVTG